MLRIIFCTLFVYPIVIYAGIKQDSIDRWDLVMRNNPHNDKFDALSSLTVGNGEFAYTADITGLQTFPLRYSKGVSLGTQSQWGWHTFKNENAYAYSETLKSFDFGRGHPEIYPVLHPDDPRKNKAAEWYRMNAQRLHLGIIGFDMDEAAGMDAISAVSQELDLWNGVIKSKFDYEQQPVSVETIGHPEKDGIAAHIRFTQPIAIKFKFPYPNGENISDACSWDKKDRHSTKLISLEDQQALLQRTIDTTIYYVLIQWEGAASFEEKEAHYFVLTPKHNDFSFSCTFTRAKPDHFHFSYDEAARAAKQHWNAFWKKGAAVDFSNCTDARAKELERRVVLSQYLLAVQCAGSTPPQETGLTYNSWYGKFHMEMVWWHQAHFAVWNREEPLSKTLEYYRKMMPVAKSVANQSGFDGIRWMKMTDPSGQESPSQVGPFLIWQQPHVIYLAELLYRNNPTIDFLRKYDDLVEETAKFMASFLVYDKARDRYAIQGMIPAQEIFSPEKTVNPPFELSYWHFGLTLAQKWRERLGKGRNPEWDKIIAKLSKLPVKDGLILAAESAPDSYTSSNYSRDHMIVLGAYGVLPDNPLFQKKQMLNTLHWVMDNWQWNNTWGWDFPMTAMCATRLGQPEIALNALLKPERTNTYLSNGHNYQNDQLRIYLPGNGGLLTAVALMCAGWDSCHEKNPGFPKNGEWNVKWEGLKPMP